MPKETMISGDWWKQVEAKTKPKYVTWAAQPFSVVIDFDKDIADAMKEDPLILQKLSDAGSEAYKAFIAAAAVHVDWAEDRIARAAADFDRDADARALGMMKASVEVAFERRMESEVTKAEKDIEAAILEAWDKYVKTKKDYRNYKLKAAAKLVFKAATFALSVMRIVASAGADVLAWRSAVKDVLKVVQEVSTLAMDAEEVRASAEKSLDAVLSLHKKLGDGAGATASEVGLGLLKLLIGTDCGKTIDSLEQDVKAYRNKLGGLEKQAHEAARALNGLLTESSKVKDGLPKDIVDDIAAVEAQVDKLIKEIVALQEGVKSGHVWVDTMTKILNDMKSAKNISKLKALFTAMESVVDMVTTVRIWSNFEKTADGIIKNVGTQAGIVYKNYEKWNEEIAKLKKAG